MAVNYFWNSTSLDYQLIKYALSPPPSVTTQLCKTLAGVNTQVYVAHSYPLDHNPLLSKRYLRALDDLPVQKYMETVLRMPIEEQDSIFRHESYRRKTFLAGWPHNDNPKLTFAKMAKEGFYYLGDSDRVKCSFCSGVVRGWEEEDDPRTEHQRLFSWCGFVTAAETAKNIPMNPLNEQAVQTILQIPADGKIADLSGMSIESTQIDKLKLKVFMIEPENRKKTFAGWRTRGFHQIIESSLLVDAGFVRQSLYTDRVKCYDCGLELYNWEKWDNPWVEHTRWYPECPFVLGMRGQQYVDDILAATPDVYKLVRKDFTEKPNLPVLKPFIPDYAKYMYNTCLQLKHEREVIDEAIRRNGVERFSNVSEMLDAIYKVKESSEIDLTTGTTKVESLNWPKVGFTEENQSNFFNNCKLCELLHGKETTADHVALPCGHLVFCQKCYQEMEIHKPTERKIVCPYYQCGAFVYAAIHVYLS